MIDLLAKWSKPIVILPFLLLFCYFTFVLFPKYGNQLTEIAGEKVQLLDVYPNYTKEQVTELFTKIKAEGREIHQFVSGRIDMLYPLIYGPLLMLLISFLMLKLNPNNRRGLFFAFAVPFLLMLIDYYENFTILQMLDSFPTLDANVVARGSKLVSFKFLFVVINMGMVVFSVLFWILQYIFEITFGRRR